MVNMADSNSFEKENYENFTKNQIEQVMFISHHKQWYDIWVKNFALNLNYIWNEPSAHELIPKNDFSDISSALVIGRGPSLKKFDHLNVLSKSDYNGLIICSDGILIDALKNGVTPEKFENFYVVTIDAGESIKNFYDHDVVRKFGNKIKGIFSTVTHPFTLENARNAGIKPYWLHTLFDHSEGKKSFNQISAMMVRAKNHSNGLPAIQTGGNVGTSAWFVAWRILKCKKVGLIGIDHSWNENDSWEKIVSHGNDTPNQVKIDPKSELSKRLFPKIYNPDFNCNCILDPIFQYYSLALKEFIHRSPEWLQTINATEGGCIFGDRITCMTLKSFLK